MFLRNNIYQESDKQVEKVLGNVLMVIDHLFVFSDPLLTPKNYMFEDRPLAVAEETGLA